MRKLIATAVAGLVLAMAPIATPHAEATPKLGTWCKALKKQPAYSYRTQGAKVWIPAGKRLIGKRPNERKCKALVQEYRSHKNAR